MKLTIINYGSGNLHSVHKAFQKANSELQSPFSIEVTNDPKQILNADKIVLPGVGAFSDCKNSIIQIDGLFEALKELVIQKKKPFMGICVGMQLLADRSDEFGDHKGFGWISGRIKEIPKHKDCKIPHMGWNEVNFNAHDLFAGVKQKSDFYFVHSFYFEETDQKNVLATTQYPEKITAAVIKENIFGTQFHPEKSHENGKTIIKNFLEWNY